METVHRLVEDEFFDLESFSSRSEFLAKAHTYQLYFNLVRPNSHKQNLSPWQIRVPQDHSLRPLRVMTDEALRELQPRFHKLYARTGRPSIAPEKLLWALLLQALYSVRSERLMEQLDYNLLFRWFVGLNMDDAIWDVTVFTKNRERLRWGHCRSLLPSRAPTGAGAESALGRALRRGWNATGSVGECEELSTQGWPAHGSAERSWQCDGGLARGEAANQTHASKTDPDAKMARKGKGKEAKLSYNGNLLVENRHGLIVNTEVFEANGTAERDAALVMLEQIPGTKQVTVGGDKAYDTADFVAECRNLKVTPHVAQNLERPGGSAIDARHATPDMPSSRNASVSAG